MRTLARSRDRKLFGVAGGMAEYFDMDKTLWRAIWVFGCILMPPAILAYLILAVVIPEAPGGNQPDYVDVTPGESGSSAPRRRMAKSRDRWLSGVAAGIAEYFNVDPALVRLLFIVAVILGFGSGILVYILLAILMPEPGYQDL